MTNVTVICDRCGKTVEGLHYPGEATAGYYDVTGSPWDAFANPGENIVCDECMWADERYMAVYGDMRPKPPTLSEIPMDERYFISFDDVGRAFVQSSNLDLVKIMPSYFEITKEQYDQFKAELWKPKAEDFRREP